MPDLLESGKLKLSAEEAKNYRSAAAHLHETCAMALDLAQPVTVTDLILLSVAKAGLDGDTAAVELVIAKVEGAIRQKARPQ
jgi:hypothetical protein